MAMAPVLMIVGGPVPAFPDDHMNSWIMCTKFVITWKWVAEKTLMITADDLPLKSMKNVGEIR